MGEVPRLWRLLVLLHTDYKLTVDWGNFPQLDFVAVLQHGDDEVPYFKGVQQKLKQQGEFGLWKIHVKGKEEPLYGVDISPGGEKLVKEVH